MGCCVSETMVIQYRSGKRMSLLAGFLFALWILPVCVLEAKAAVLSPNLGRTTLEDGNAGYDVPGTINYPNGAMTWMDTVTGNDGEREFKVTLIDESDGFAYLVTNGLYLTKIIKVRLGSMSEQMERVSELIINDRRAMSAVIDAENDYMYIGTYDCRIIKVHLGAASDPPSLIGETVISTGCKFSCGVIDPAAGFAYFGILTTTEPGMIVKVALGEGPALPYGVGLLWLEEGETDLTCAMIDAVAGYAYFCTGTTPSKVIKVILGEGSETPVRHSAIRLLDGEKAITCAVLDSASGYAYLGLWGEFNVSAPRIVKISVGQGSEPMTRIGAIEPGTIYDDLSTAVIDPGNGYAYFGMLIGAS